MNCGTPIAPAKDPSGDSWDAQELRRVFEPFRRLDDWSLHRCNDLRLELRGREPAVQLSSIESVLDRQLVDQHPNIGALRIARRDLLRRRDLPLGSRAFTFGCYDRPRQSHDAARAKESVDESAGVRARHGWPARERQHRRGLQTALVDKL